MTIFKKKEVDMQTMEETVSATQAVQDVYESYQAEEAKKATLRRNIEEAEKDYKKALADYTEASGLDDEEMKAKASGEMKALKQRIREMKTELEGMEKNPVKTLEDVRSEGERQEIALKEHMSEIEGRIAGLKNQYLEAISEMGDIWRDLYYMCHFLHSTTGEQYFPGVAPEWGAFEISEKELCAAYGQRPTILTFKIR
jgi:chromosome segregation ATPase